MNTILGTMNIEYPYTSQKDNSIIKYTEIIKMIKHLLILLMAILMKIM